MFPLHNIYKFTRTSPDVKTHNQIVDILIDKRGHSSVLDVHSFWSGECVTDHYLVVAKVKERLAVNKQRSQRFHMERFNLKKLNEIAGKVKYCIQVSNRFVALEDFYTEMEINSAWEMIRENINISAKQSLGHFKLKKHRPWFNEGSKKTS
jgi:hypothetical protein